MVNGSLAGWMDGLTDGGRMDGWTDGRKDESMVGQMDVYIYIWTLKLSNLNTLMVRKKE